jgi:hypothetical protein
VLRSVNLTRNVHFRRFNADGNHCCLVHCCARRLVEQYEAVAAALDSASQALQIHAAVAEQSQLQVPAALADALQLIELLESTDGSPPGEEFATGALQLMQVNSTYRNSDLKLKLQSIHARHVIYMRSQQ